MTKQNTYTHEDIIVLSDREHVRKRTNVYLGNMNKTTYKIPILDSNSLNLQEVSFIPAAYKAIGEILDNAIDEFTQISKPNKKLVITADPENGQYTISDNGRGIPIDKHSSGRYTPEVVVGSLRSGRNFEDDSKLAGEMGVNGVGACCTNYCSSKFEVKINRDNKQYTQTFTNGAAIISSPEVVDLVQKQTGTTVSFTLDRTIFSDVSIANMVIRNRAIEIAMTNKNVTVEYNNEVFKFNNGIEDVVASIASGKQFSKIEVDGDNISGVIYLIPNGHNELDETIFTWINSSLLFDGGKCNTQFFNAIFDKVIDHLQSAAKKSKTIVTRNDIRQNLLAFADLKIKNPEYDSQSKTRLTGPDLKKEFVSAIDSNWKQIAKQQSQWLEQVISNAIARHRISEDQSAQASQLKKIGKKIPGLLDATNKDRTTCQILILEGECLHESTKIAVVTTDGYKQLEIKDVNVGDYVISHSGTLSVVTNKTTVMEKGITFTTKFGTFTCSQNHRWLVHDSNTDQFIWLPAKDIDKSKHCFVRHKAANAQGYISFTKSEINEDPLYQYQIDCGHTAWHASKSHPFAVINFETMQFITVTSEQLDNTKHGLLVFKE